MFELQFTIQIDFVTHCIKRSFMHDISKTFFCLAGIKCWIMEMLFDGVYVLKLVRQEEKVVRNAFKRKIALTRQSSNMLCGNLERNFQL